MSSLNEIKRHLSAVEETRQITNAMYLLSTARMKRNIKNIDYNLKYMNELRATIKDILAMAREEEIFNSYIGLQASGSAMFITVSSDKGLCGDYNSNVVDLTLSKMKNYKSSRIISLGLAGSSLFSSRGIKPDLVRYGASQHPTITLAREISERIVRLYSEEDVRQIFIVYTRYINSAVQTPVCERMLPLLEEDYADIKSKNKYSGSFESFLSLDTVINQTISQYLVGYIFDILNQSACSENIMRMNAMQNATRNADEMISSLRKNMNAARQLSITNEITEIAAASDIPGAV